jgi:hypothetical protein
MVNIPVVPGLLVLLLSLRETYCIRFTLFRRQRAWLNNQLVVNKSSDDSVVLCELANGYVTAEFVNLILDVGVHPNGVH